MSVSDLGVVAFAFSAGAAAFFAPCSYPLLPGYLAYFIGESATTQPRDAPVGRAAVVGLYVIVGFLLVFTTLGAVVAVAGTHALANAVLLEPLIGGLLIVLGTSMALGRPIAPRIRLRFPARRRRATAYVLFGVVYAAAAAGCTAPLFLAVAGVAIQGGLGRAVLGVGGYAAGMSTLLVGVTVVVAYGRDAVLRRLSANTARIRRVAGVLIVLAGVAQLYLFVVRYDGLRLLGL